MTSVVVVGAGALGLCTAYHLRAKGVEDAMSEAQTPAQAAAWPAELALARTFDPAFYGELVQFGRVIPWETGVPVPHTAAA